MKLPPGYTIKRVYLIQCEWCNEEITRPLGGEDVESRADAEAEVREHHRAFHAGEP